MLLRTPQKWECSIGGVAVTHDFETGFTTSLNIGYAFELDQYKVQTAPPERLALFLGQIKDAHMHLSHPLLLPCLFLATHVQLVRKYLWDHISSKVVNLEESVGITSAGRSQSHLFKEADRDKPRQHLFVNGQMQRARAKELIAEINDITTWIVFAKRSPQWDMDCIDLVLDLLSCTKLQLYCGSSDKVFRELVESFRRALRPG